MTSAAGNVIAHLLGALPLAARNRDDTDAELLQRFLVARDETAFASLLARHGPLVLGVCRRILRDGHAAEDAFQATFLLLARRARELSRAGSLAGWLHAVAWRTASQARRADERRRRREVRAARPVIATADDLAWREVRELLDAELARLPEDHRTPLILCYLNGLSQTEAARQLGCSPAALRGRLERGRQALRRRLARLGLSLSALLVPAVPASVSAALRTATLATVRANLSGECVVPAVARLAATPRLLAAGQRKAAAGLLFIAVTLGLAVTGAPRAGGPSPSPAPATAPAARARVDLLDDPLPADALHRLGTLRHRHLSLWYTPKQPLPDGKTVLTSTNEEVHWVDMTTGRLSDSWRLPRGYQVSGFSPDGRLALFFDDWTFRLWDVGTRKELRRLQLKGRYGTPSETFFSADGKVVVVLCGVISAPGVVRAFDIATGQELWQEGIPGDRDRGLRPLGFLADGKTLVALEMPGSKITLRDRNTGKELRSFATRVDRETRTCCLTPDGKTVFMGTGGATVRAWNVVSGKELPPLRGHKGQAHTVAVSRDSKTVLTGGVDPSVLVWDWPSGKLRRRIELDSDGINAMTVSADGKRAQVQLLGETALRFFDLATGKQQPPPIEGHRGQAECVAVTPGGTVYSASSDGTFRAWDLRSGRHLRSRPIEPRPEGAMLVSSPDHRLVARASTRDGVIVLYEWETGRRVQTIDSGGTVLWSVTFSPDGKHLAACGFSTTMTGQYLHFVRIWDVARGRRIRELEDASRVLAFSSDGRSLAGFNSFDGKAVQVWETATGRLRMKLPQKNITALAFAPDGRSLACSGPQGVTLWELATGKKRSRIEASTSNAALLCFSADSRWLSRGDGRTVHLYDALRGQKVHAFQGHDDNVLGLAFAPDGSALVSASADSTLLVWDLSRWRRQRP